jgi:hypothetical protein
MKRAYFSVSLLEDALFRPFRLLGIRVALGDGDREEAGDSERRARFDDEAAGDGERRTRFDNKAAGDGERRTCFDEKAAGDGERRTRFDDAVGPRRRLRGGLEGRSGLDPISMVVAGF